MPNFCEFSRCFEKSLETIFIGPNNENLCAIHFTALWREYREMLKLKMGLPATRLPRLKGEISGQKIVGVLMVFPGLAKPVKGYWTPQRCAPHRCSIQKYGLRRWYARDEVMVVNWGKNCPVPPVEAGRGTSKSVGKGG